MAWFLSPDGIYLLKVVFNTFIEHNVLVILPSVLLGNMESQ
jgi:hypothetical protein